MASEVEALRLEYEAKLTTAHQQHETEVRALKARHQRELRQVCQPRASAGEPVEGEDVVNLSLIHI
eukprot:6514202-Alexandrium_andersonii.AAC.1